MLYSRNYSLEHPGGLADKVASSNHCLDKVCLIQPLLCSSQFCRVKGCGEVWVLGIFEYLGDLRECRGRSVVWITG